MSEWSGQTEDSEEISVVERRFVPTTHKRQTYRCACNAALLTAPGYSLDFAVEVVVQKYSEHLPLDRQVRQKRRQGLLVTSHLMCDGYVVYQRWLEGARGSRWSFAGRTYA